MREPVNDLDKELRQALRRKEPSQGFAARVMANLPEKRPSVWVSWFHAPVVRWAAAAIVLVAVTSGGYAYREHEREVERGRMAKQQLMLALRITGTKLQLVQQRTQQMGADRAAAPQHQTEKN